MATLPSVEIGFGSNKTAQYRQNLVDFGDGYSQRSADGLNNKVEVWDVVWDSISTADANTLESFFDTNNGGVTNFSWTPPGEVTAKNYILSPGSLRRTPEVGGATVTMRAKFVQVFDL